MRQTIIKYMRERQSSTILVLHFIIFVMKTKNRRMNYETKCTRLSGF